MFIDAGVMHLPVYGEGQSRSFSDQCFFTRFDLEARGLGDLALRLGVNTLDDQEVAARMREFHHCVTWK